MTVMQEVPFGLHAAALAGVPCGMVFNFIGKRFSVFKKKSTKEQSSRVV
jgi:putative flippase GtrA